MSFVSCLRSIARNAVTRIVSSRSTVDAKNCMERDCPGGINEGTGPLKNTKAPLTHAACVPFTDPTPLHEKLEIKYSILPVSKFLSRNKVFLLVVGDDAAREKRAASLRGNVRSSYSMEACD